LQLNTGNSLQCLGEYGMFIMSARACMQVCVCMNPWIILRWPSIIFIRYIATL